MPSPTEERTENPVLLWGDMGPDVYKLSQIYDPRNDKYVTTQDTSPIKISESEWKHYYERLDMILTTDTVVQDGKPYYKRIVNEVDSSVVFTRVPTSELIIIVPGGEPIKANPAANKWYQDSGGKIKVFSKVNLATWASEHGITIEQINPYLPYGTQGKEEKDWIHWYEVNEGAENTCGKYVPAVDSLVVVDETECYYKTENKYKTRMLLTVKSVDYALNVEFATIVFGTDTEETTRAIDYGNEKFMLFFNRKAGASLDNILLTPDRKAMLYGKESYAYRLKRSGVIISKNKPTIQTADDAFVPFARAAGQKITITDGDVFETIKKTLPYIDVVLPTGFSRTLCLAEETTRIHTCDVRFQMGAHYVTKTGGDIPGTAYTVGSLISEWEKNDPEGREVWRDIKEDLIGRVAYCLPTHTAEVPSGCVFLPESCQLRSNYSIVDGESILMEIFSFNQETREANLIMTLTLTSREATALDATDVTTRQIVKFDVELNGYDDVGDVWYLQQGEDWREVFHLVPKISFDDGSDLTVPVDGKTCYRYGFEDINSTLVGREFQVLFKFFPHKSMNIDWQKVGLTPTKNYLYVRKTIKIINNLAYKIRKISLIPAWNQATQAYDFYFMIFRNDFMSPPIIGAHLDTRYTIETYKVTEDTTVVTGKEYYQRQNSGYFLNVKLDKSKPISEQGFTVYERTLQPKTSIDDVQYMNANGDVQYVGATASGSTFDVTQRAKLAERVTVRGMTAKSIYTQDVRFRLQNMMLKDKRASLDSRLPYKWLIGDDHTSYEGETMPYGKVPKRPYLLYTYDHTNELTGKTVGQYRVDATQFDDVTIFLKAFYQAAQPPRGVAEDGTVETDEFTPTHFFIRSIADGSACTEFVTITEGGSTHLDPVLMEGGGKSDTDVGGAIPCKVDDEIYGQGTTTLMGTVVVEFVHRYQDPDDATKYLYKHLYAVPVETRDTAW